MTAVMRLETLEAKREAFALTAEVTVQQLHRQRLVVPKAEDGSELGGVQPPGKGDAVAFFRFVAAAGAIVPVVARVKDLEGARSDVGQGNPAFPSGFLEDDITHWWMLGEVSVYGHEQGT